MHKTNYEEGKERNVTTKSTLKGKHRLPLNSSVPGKGKARCLRAIKLLSTETKMREHRPRHADDRFLLLK